jgi:enoyl-CoA hydratase/carnithine racemase
MSADIRIEREGSVVRVTLDRPDKLNAQTPGMWLHLAEQGAILAADESIRAVVVAGAGRSFSAGIDIGNFTGGAGEGGDGAGGLTSGAAPGAGTDPIEGVRALQAGFEWLETAPFLTIARVQGHAFGAGMQLALACDIRVCADDVQMGLLELNWGLMPDLGGTVWLPRLIGPSAALEHMLRGDKWRADDLLRLGIANKVVAHDDLDAAIDEYVQLATSRPPLAIRGAKRAIREGWGQPTADGMIAAGRAQLACIRSADFREAGAAFVEQRTPNFTGK